MKLPIDKSLEVGKNEEDPALKKRFNTNYLKKMWTSSGAGKQKKKQLNMFSNRGIAKDAKAWPACVSTYFLLFRFASRCFLHQPTSPATKAIRAHVFLTSNPSALPRKLKMVPAIFPTIAGNASSAFPPSFLRASTSLFIHFFKVPSRFVGKTEPLPPKTPVIANTIIGMVREREISNNIIVKPC